jgi:hypothetical protein
MMVCLGFVSLCEKLEKHDPDTSIAVASVRDGATARRLGEALRKNKIVTEVRLNLSLVKEEEEDEGFTILATALSYIRKVTFQGSNRRSEVTAALVGRFLRALSASRFIRAVTLKYTILSQDTLEGLLSSQKTSLRYIEIDSCHILNLPDVLQVNAPEAIMNRPFPAENNIEHAVMKGCNHEPTRVAFLKLLGRLPQLETLALDVPRRFTTQATSDALKNILESRSGQLEKLRLTGFPCEYNTFHPVAQGLMQSRSVSNLSLKQCSFCDRSTLLFESMLRESLIRDLSIRFGVSFGALPASLVLARVIQNTSLTTLSLKRCNLGPAAYAHVLFAVMQSDDCRLHSLTFAPSFQSKPWRETLIEFLPTLHLQELNLWLPEDLAPRKKEDMLSALKRNRSLTRVVFEPIIPIFGALTRREEKQVRRYCRRNKKVPGLIKVPEQLPDLLWPKLMVVLQQRENGVKDVFQGLIGLADAVGRSVEAEDE